MYGIVEIKGHQYKVRAGDIIDVQKMEEEVGTTVELDQVLFIGGDAPKVGTPVVAGAKVVAEVVEQARAKKIKIIKFRRRKHHMKQQGHRQYFTALKIKSVQV